jgi:hypothetical protein
VCGWGERKREKKRERERGRERENEREREKERKKEGAIKSQSWSRSGGSNVQRAAGSAAQAVAVSLKVIGSVSLDTAAAATSTLHFKRSASCCTEWQMHVCQLGSQPASQPAS